MRGDGYRHEALFYFGEADYAERVNAFVREGLNAGEPVLVVAPYERLRVVAEEFHDVPDTALELADMQSVGSNPARIIPLWQDFVSANAGTRQRLRGVGEPIHPGRSASALAECQQYEALLNVAFEPDVPLWLLCPYDASVQPPEVLAEAQRAHPTIIEGDAVVVSREYGSLARQLDWLRAPLDEPLEVLGELEFGARNIDVATAFAQRQATAAGLARGRAQELALAVHELARNSVQHGGGGGYMRFWRDVDEVVCEVRDPGEISDPLVGRRRPDDADSPRGLWVVNQLCDLVQLRTGPFGTTVRLRMAV